jgi:hypothetical protein
LAPPVAVAAGDEEALNNRRLERRKSKERKSIDED